MKKILLYFIINLSLLFGCHNNEDEDYNDDDNVVSGWLETTTNHNDTEENNVDDSSDSSNDAENECIDNISFTPLRRITDIQYYNTIKDLFDNNIEPNIEIFPQTLTSFDYTNNPDSNLVSLMGAEEIMLSAEDISNKFIDNIQNIVPCDINSEECAESYIELISKKAYRKPLTQQELELLNSLYHKTRETNDISFSLGIVINTILQSPQFLYLTEIGTYNDSNSNLVELTNYELASRLSYLIWDSMPDNELFEKAEQNLLWAPQELEEQAVRLLNNKIKSAPVIIRFYKEWMRIHPIAPYDKDVDKFPQFTEDFINILENDYRDYITSVIFGNNPTYNNLLLFNKIIENDANNRIGLLSRPLLLAEHSNAGETSVIFRGKLIREQLLCENIPPPPPDAMSMAPEFPPNTTQREKTEIFLQHPVCGTCHRMMNPIGLGFENYDPIGLWRDIDVDGSMVDASGEILYSSPDLSGEFYGIDGLANKLSNKEKTYTCFINHYYRYTFGLEQTNQCTLDSLKTIMIDNDGNIYETMIDFIMSEMFKNRKVNE